MHWLLYRCLKYGEDFNGEKFLPHLLLSKIKALSTICTVHNCCVRVVMALKDAAIEINVDNVMYFDIGNVTGLSNEDARTDYFNSLSHRRWGRNFSPLKSSPYFRHQRSQKWPRCRNDQCVAAANSSDRDPRPDYTGITQNLH